MTLDEGKTMFAGPKDVGRLVHAVIASNAGFMVASNNSDGGQVPFADPSVYTGRQPFRIYGAAKYNEPDRMLFPQGQAATSWATWDPDVCCFGDRWPRLTAALPGSLHMARAPTFHGRNQRENGRPPCYAAAWRASVRSRVARAVDRPRHCSRRAGG